MVTGGFMCLEQIELTQAILSQTKQKLQGKKSIPVADQPTVFPSVTLPSRPQNSSGFARCRPRIVVPNVCPHSHRDV
jgi:hypothetical protein